MVASAVRFAGSEGGRCMLFLVDRGAAHPAAVCSKLEEHVDRSVLGLFDRSEVHSQILFFCGGYFSTV